MNQHSDRRYIIAAIMVLLTVIMLVKLFYIQIIDDQYKFSAYNNSQRLVTQYPSRGLIYDRFGKLMVSNKAAYDLMISPLEVRQFDTLELASLIRLDIAELKERMRKASKYSRYKPSEILKLLSTDEYAVLQEKLYKYPGFFVQTRSIREYAAPIASHLLGYVGEVNDEVIQRDNYYKMGDYIGVSGIELFYEKYLRGIKGVKIFLVDVHNRIVGSFQEGKHDKTAVVGKDVTITIDAELQEYGEYLMQKKIGSIVAIAPRTGEILSLVSSPSYDPGLLVGRDRALNYHRLNTDSTKPLFNRALMAMYPPGSTFKLVNALIALKEGLINAATTFSCFYGFSAGPITVGCHAHRSPLNLVGSIQNSCNAYYCNVYKRILTDRRKFLTTEEAYNNWRNHVVSFGFGSKLGSDFYNELKGSIPSSTYYNKIYGKNSWSYLTVISLAIGQGEFLITPLQMANMAAAIANRGYYYTPHVIKKIQGEENVNAAYRTKHQTSIDSTLFKDVIEGMYLAVNGPPGGGGTAGMAKIDSIDVCGKTGTAQNPHGEDHSIFIAFAPKENPEIAIAVYIENAGFGGTWAAPLASLMIEKYIKRKVKRTWLEDYVKNATFENKKKTNR